MHFQRKYSVAIILVLRTYMESLIQVNVKVRCKRFGINLEIPTNFVASSQRYVVAVWLPLPHIMLRKCDIHDTQIAISDIMSAKVMLAS